MAHKSEIINTEKHPFIGVSWPVVGSKGNEYKLLCMIVALIVHVLHLGSVSTLKK